MVVLFFLAILLLVPVAVVGAAVVALVAVKAGVRRLLSGARAPNGALDGRRNVRVIVSDRHEN